MCGKKNGLDNEDDAAVELPHHHFSGQFNCPAILFLRTFTQRNCHIHWLTIAQDGQHNCIAGGFARDQITQQIIER